ncbi:MAG: DNA methyltransferase [Ignavibacteriaceae bacterium]
MPLPKNIKKAPFNRTLTLNEKEIRSLRKDLITKKSPLSLSEINNKIICQNIFEALDNLPANFIDLLFIDPPYNLHKKFNTVSFKAIDDLDYEKWVDSWLQKIIRMLKPNASIYICGDWKSSQAIYKTAKKYFKVQNRITWEREKGRGAKKNWKNCSEDIWFFTMSNNYIFNVDEVKIKRKVLAPYKNTNGEPKDWKTEAEGNFRISFPSNIWTDISVPFWSMPENTEHPTQKPEKLLAKIILASTNKGDFVFDPFLGAGTTAVAAKKLGRNFSGVEIDEHYCCIAQKRLMLADIDNSIQGYSDGVFWERNSFKFKGKSSNDKE